VQVLRSETLLPNSDSWSSGSTQRFRPADSHRELQVVEEGLEFGSVAHVIEILGDAGIGGAGIEPDQAAGVGLVGAIKPILGVGNVAESRG
jgi:hypothetical protein